MVHRFPHTLLVLLLAAAGWVRAGEAREQVLLLPTRKGVQLPCLLRATEPGPPRAVAVLFPGGEGRVGLPADGAPPALDAAGNFLVRTRGLLADAEVAVAVVDAPSDQPGGMDDGFRSGPAHRADIAILLAELQARFPGAGIYLVGTSRGTISAAHLGVSLGEAVSGVVLTSTIFVGTRRGGPGLQGFDFGRIKVPLLFVHSAEDGCPSCPYAAAGKLGLRFPLVTVRGGAEPESGPCGPLSRHGYLGREPAVIAAIRQWILGRPFPARIE